MADWAKHQTEIANIGYSVIEDVFTPIEVQTIIDAIESADKSKITFRQSDDLFAIRQFLKELPELEKVIFSDRLKELLVELTGNDYFVCKSIYFDKPRKSNWFVAWHQDLTVSVKERVDIEGFGPWTVKHQQFAVQPPQTVLEDNFTIRIHLDDTDDKNGALKVVPASHLKGVVRVDEMDWSNIDSDSCNVKSGGVMLMKPLLFHASGKTVNDKQRRVVHIEFSRATLPSRLNWSEKSLIDFN